MSPTPARTSRDAITAAARAILEEDGLDAVSMQAVATRVGVRPPSLYKHVADRTALIRAVSAAVTADLAQALGRSGPSGDPRAELRSMARRYRAFVRTNPAGYALLFTPPSAGFIPDETALAALGTPIVSVTARIVGEDSALDAARTFVAWAHGFTSLELAGGFRLGGDVDAAYVRGIELIIAGLSGPARPGSASRRRG
jgi:AcrR family transcriptional regulator